MASSVFLFPGVFQSDGSTITFPSGISLSIADGSVTITRPSIGVTSTDGLVLTNTTAAAVGAQQMSPRVHFHGSGWKTDATAGAQVVDVINELLPVQGASAPTANLLWKYSVNGGAYGTILTLSSAGLLTVAGPLTVVGGNVGVPTNNGIAWANGTTVYSSTDGALVLVDAANATFSRLSLGPAGGATTRSQFQKAVTAIADATGTAVLTVAIPNAAHSARVRVTLVGSLGAGGAIGANEASGTVSYDIGIAKTAGVAAVATFSTAYGSGMASVAGASTITVTAAGSAIAGGTGANTFTVNVTITKGSGASANHTCLVLAEILNANASGLTIS